MTIRSKKYRVATSGKTVDGRELTPQQIRDMAESYNPKKYGARIWMEHLRGILPDSVFKALGDVISVEARDVEDGKVALFAELEPTPELVKMNRDRQKVFTSIEVMTDPDSGKAYLGGLAVTDSPASTGTEMLKFSCQQNQKAMFTDYIEGAQLEFVDVDEKPADGLFAKVKELLGSSSKKTNDQFSAAMTDVHSAVEAIASSVANLETKFAAISPNGDKDEIKQLRADLDALTKKLSATPQNKDREMHSGGESAELTDC